MDFLKIFNNNRIYNPTPNHRKIRKNIVYWIQNLVKKLNYSRHTYHLTIAIIDTIFSKCDAKNTEYKLICFVSLHLAAKF